MVHRFTELDFFKSNLAYMNTEVDSGVHQEILVSDDIMGKNKSDSILELFSFNLCILLLFLQVKNVATV